MKRYLIENHGPNDANVKFMFRESLRMCQREGISRITLCVPNKGDFPTTIVGRLLGDAAKKLCKGQTVLLPGNLPLDLVCANKIPHSCTYEMIIGVYLSLDAIYKLDSIHSAKAIMFLPWTEHEGKKWLSTWDATILGTNTWHVQQTSLPPDVENALSGLTHGINLSTGLIHPFDRKAARSVLTELRDLGHALCSADVRSWAVRNGWRPDDAKDLADEVARIFKSDRA